MEILAQSKYKEYEEFAEQHPQGCFTQSVFWPKVKNNWDHAVVVSRDSEGKIRGGMLVLIQKIPFIGTTFLYAPRGPVCDLHDREVLSDLVEGVKMLAKQRRAHAFKMDPDVLISDTEFIDLCKSLGFTHFTGGENFETIQARFNYRLYLGGRTEEELFMNLHSKTRYNVRVAMKKGVEVKVVGPEYLDDFVRIMETTGQRPSRTLWMDSARKKVPR